MGWWKVLSPEKKYYQISRSSVYWVMARSMPVGPHADVDVRYLLCPDFGVDIYGFVSPFVLPTSQGLPTSAAGAFWLPVNARVYMMPKHGDLRLYPYTLLSLVELKGPILR